MVVFEFIVFPSSASTMVSVHSTSSDGTNWQGKMSMKRILLVDDEPDITLVMKLVFEENGFKVDSFTDGSEALENFRTGLYDLAILDIKMPEMDGFSLYEKIKKFQNTSIEA